MCVCACVCVSMYMRVSVCAHVCVCACVCVCVCVFVHTCMPMYACFLHSGNKPYQITIVINETAHLVKDPYFTIDSGSGYTVSTVVKQYSLLLCVT